MVKVTLDKAVEHLKIVTQALREGILIDEYPLSFQEALRAQVFIEDYENQKKTGPKEFEHDLEKEWKQGSPLIERTNKLLQQYFHLQQSFHLEKGPLMPGEENITMEEINQVLFLWSKVKRIFCG